MHECPLDFFLRLCICLIFQFVYLRRRKPPLSVLVAGRGLSQLCMIWLKFHAWNCWRLCALKCIAAAQTQELLYSDKNQKWPWIRVKHIMVWVPLIHGYIHVLYLIYPSVGFKFGFNAFKCKPHTPTIPLCKGKPSVFTSGSAMMALPVLDSTSQHNHT